MAKKDKSVYHNTGVKCLKGGLPIYLSREMTKEEVPPSARDLEPTDSSSPAPDLSLLTMAIPPWKRDLIPDPLPAPYLLKGSSIQGSWNNMIKHTPHKRKSTSEKVIRTTSVRDPQAGRGQGRAGSPSSCWPGMAKGGNYYHRNSHQPSRRTLPWGLQVIRLGSR